MIWLRCWPSFKMVGHFLFEIGLNQICLRIYRTRSVLSIKNYCHFCRFVIRFVKRCTLPEDKCNILQIIRIHTSTLIWAQKNSNGKEHDTTSTIIPHHPPSWLNLTINLSKELRQTYLSDDRRGTDETLKQCVVLEINSAQGELRSYHSMVAWYMI